MALIRIYSKNNYSKWGIPEMFWMCATKQQQQSSQTNIQLRWRLTSETRDKKSAFLWLLLFSHSVMSDSLWPHGLQHSRLPCPSLSPRVCSNSCLLSRWCHPTILSSAAPSSYPQSFPASGSAPCWGYTRERQRLPMSRAVWRLRRLSLISTDNFSSLI